MQVDLLHIMSLSAWSSESCLEEKLGDKPYELISCSAGPVRASACVASHPFKYSYVDPLRREERTLTCRLHRVLSLYRGADFVVDELSVRGTHDGHEDAGAVELHFNARYLMHMDFGYGVNPNPYTGAESSPQNYFRIPDWFALSCGWAPYQSYGFATSAHAGSVANPHPGFPDGDNNLKTFSFSLGRASQATCVHLFARCNEESIEHRAGLAWYEHVFRPLKVEIASGQKPLAQPNPSATVTSRNSI